MAGKAIFFSANDGSHGYEIWKTDGTSTGTALLRDIQTGSNNSYPVEITSLGNGVAVFQADDGLTGSELWVTNGTSAGTSLLVDIYSGAIGSVPHYLTPFGNGKALFSAVDGVVGNELWVTDGTSAGTSLVRDLYPGTGNSDPRELTPLDGGNLVFRADDGTHGAELWVTDGTSAGTSLLRDIYAGALSGDPEDITAIGNGKALFQANDGVHGTELWVTDGTSAGTSLVRMIDAGPFSSYPDDITPIGNGRAIFKANDGNAGAEIWVTDGTSAGTSLVWDTNPGPSSSYPADITSLGNGKALFRANDGVHGYELWVTDGSSAGTSLVLDIHGGPANAFPDGLTSLGNGKAVFNANDGSHGRELWVTDGTSAGTSLVRDINPGSDDANPDDIVALGDGTGLFKATDGINGYELWRTDGTSAGTLLVQNINAGAANSNPSGFVAVGVGVTTSVACFAAGTRIRTPDRDIPVEALREGDMVVTLTGEARAIRWIGHRRIDLSRHAEPERVTPVRISAGAFSDGIPGRDLLVSPDHAVFAGGLLIPARLLVNGASITIGHSFPAINYYHIELDTHDILLAEGLPAESYLDTGNRGMFGNAGLPVRLHPDFAAGQWQRETLSCAPFAAGPLQVEPIWRALTARAEALGHALPKWVDEPDLHVLIGSRRLNPVVAGADHYVFLLPGGGAVPRLMSRAARPRETCPWIDDRRRLGVMVREMRWVAKDTMRTLPMDDPELEEGWWPVEEHAGAPRRWTKGEATLPALGGGRLDIVLGGTLWYPAEPAVGDDQDGAAPVSAGGKRQDRARSVIA